MRSYEPDREQHEGYDLLNRQAWWMYQSTGGAGSESQSRRDREERVLITRMLRESAMRIQAEQAK